MSRLVSMFLLWLLLLLAAAPASAVMDVQPRNGTWELPASSYDLAPDVRDGPNLYAYVKQNPWTSFDPDGLAETKPYYVTKGRRGIQKLEADPNDSRKPLTRTNADGKTEVQVNQYDVSSTLHHLTNYKGESTGSSWEPAENYGVKSPTSSARRNFETNNDPQVNMQAIGEGANKPLVRGLNAAIQTTFTEGAHALLAASGTAAGMYVLRSAANASKGLGNPFKGKTAQQIHDMFIGKGFQPRGPSPATGKGGYVNPKNGRSYHIDEANSFGEPAHVDVNRLRSYKGPLEKKKYDMGGDAG